MTDVEAPESYCRGDFHDGSPHDELGDDSDEDYYEEWDEDSDEDFDDYEASDDDEEKVPKSELLSRTLSSSPKLGRLVKRLILITSHHEYWTTEEHIQIVKHCTELEDLQILGYSIKLLTEYKAAYRCVVQLAQSNNISSFIE
jgi:hypothetical protein